MALMTMQGRAVTWMMNLSAGTLMTLLNIQAGAATIYMTIRNVRRSVLLLRILLHSNASLSAVVRTTTYAQSFNLHSVNRIKIEIEEYYIAVSGSDVEWVIYILRDFLLTVRGIWYINRNSVDFAVNTFECILGYGKTKSIRLQHTRVLGSNGPSPTMC